MEHQVTYEKIVKLISSSPNYSKIIILLCNTLSAFSSSRSWNGSRKEMYSRIALESSEIEQMK